MKRVITTAVVICLALALITGTALAHDTGSSSIITDDGASELLPVDVIQYPDRLEIRKVYELDPGVDPGRLPRGDFERNGYAYTCADILREVVIGEEYKSITVTETAESTKNDLDTILELFPQYLEYSDEDGFSGALLLNTATIKSEVSSYGTSSTQYTISRSYPNLSDADTQFLPKSIDDNGRTLMLQNVEWRTDNTYNVDDYEIGIRYTAVVTYGGIRTSSYVRGYSITADYSGELARKGVTIIRYTVIFTGSQIPEPEPSPSPEPIAPEPSQEPDIAAPIEHKADLSWLPILISIIALLGCAACVLLVLKNRKEARRYEKAPYYDYRTDAYNSGTGSDHSVGDGDN